LTRLSISGRDRAFVCIHPPFVTSLPSLCVQDAVIIKQEVGTLAPIPANVPCLRICTFDFAR
jgi:hypothetical protein